MDALQLIGSLSTLNSGGVLPKITVYSISHGIQGTTVSTNIDRHSIYIVQERHWNKAGLNGPGVWYAITMIGNTVTVLNATTANNRTSPAPISGTLTIITDTARFYTSDLGNGGFDGTIENLLIGVD